MTHGGLTVTASTVQQQNPGFGSSGFTQAVTGLTSTGSGLLYFQTRLESKDTFNFER